MAGVVELIAAIRSQLRDERGEGPISILIGVTVFILLAFALGPAITSYTHLSAANAHLRRAGKELSALVDQQRRLPWTALDPNAAPVTKTVMLDDVPLPVTTWVTTDVKLPGIRIVHMAAPTPMSGVRCDNPSSLGSKCVVRTAWVAASADSKLPASSAGVTFTNTDSAAATGAATAQGSPLLTLDRVTVPTRVYVTGYNTGATTSGSTFSRLGVYTGGLPRTHLDLDADGTGWVFGSAVVCPAWKGQAGSGSQLIATSASGLNLSNVVVRTAPDATVDRC